MRDDGVRARRPWTEARREAMATRQRPSTARPRARRTRLVIVDDHDLFTDSLRLALSAEPDLDVVGTASRLKDARTLVRGMAPDVVLLDHRLPDGLGVDAIRELREMHEGTKVVILTAAAEDTMLVQAAEAGCAGFVLKTSPLDQLVAAVRSAAAGEIMISSDLLGRLLHRLRQEPESQAIDLTARERQILQLIAKGRTNSAIADELVISVNTVRNHVQSLLGKLQAHSKLEALAIAIRDGHISPPADASG